MLIFYKSNQIFIKYNIIFSKPQYYQVYQILISTMFMKEAVINASHSIKNSLYGLPKLQQQWLLPVLFFSAVPLDFLQIQIRNYLSGLNQDNQNDQIFIIPEKIKTQAIQKKKILVLDMDETMVHTRSLIKPSHNNYIKCETMQGSMYIQIRPYLQQFLKKATEIFTLYVYTAGEQQYADQVLDLLDTNKYIKERFYRTSCKKNKRGLIKNLKHLKKITKNKTDMILLDDNTDSINFNYPFAVKIHPFEGRQTDLELKRVFPLLMKFYT